MNEQTMGPGSAKRLAARSAITGGRRRAGAADAALDRLIERAMAALRVSDGEVARFDDLVDAEIASGVPALVPLSAARARRVLAALRQAAAGSAAMDSQRDWAAGTVTRASDQPVATFGALLHESRRRLGLTVAQVAQQLHVHRDYVAGLEAGTRSPLALGPARMCALVQQLRLVPARAVTALEAAMDAAFAGRSPGVAAGLARLHPGMPKPERRRLWEETAVQDESLAQEQREWQAILDAVASLPPPAGSDT